MSGSTCDHSPSVRSLGYQFPHDAMDEEGDRLLRRRIGRGAQRARVWDLRGERPSFVALEGHRGPVRSASFSADGTHVVTASYDDTARVWPVFPDGNALIGLVRARLSRCLSQAQRDGFGPGQRAACIGGPQLYPATDTGRTVPWLTEEAESRCFGRTLLGGRCRCVARGKSPHSARLSQNHFSRDARLFGVSLKSPCFSSDNRCSKWLIFGTSGPPGVPDKAPLVAELPYTWK
jgi:hypothetical protein